MGIDVNMKETECNVCEGVGYMVNDSYEQGDCIVCEGVGFVLDE